VAWTSKDLSFGTGDFAGFEASIRAPKLSIGRIEILDFTFACSCIINSMEV
jgi:hypothetical protein